MRPAPEAGAPLEHCSASASMLPFPAVCWGSLHQSGVLFAVPCCSVAPCCVTSLLPSLVITFDEDDDGAVEEAEEGELPARQALPKQAARPAPKQALPQPARGVAQGAAPGAKTGAGRPAGRGRGAAPVPAAPPAVPAASAGVGAAESARLRAQASSLDTCL